MKLEDTQYRLEEQVDNLGNDRDYEIRTTAKAVLHTEIPFGKHRGKIVEDVPEDYCRWLLANSTDLNPNLRLALTLRTDWASHKRLVARHLYGEEVEVEEAPPSLEEVRRAEDLALYQRKAAQFGWAELVGPELLWSEGNRARLLNKLHGISGGKPAPTDADDRAALTISASQFWIGITKLSSKDEFRGPGGGYDFAVEVGSGRSKRQCLKLPQPIALNKRRVGRGAVLFVESSTLGFISTCLDHPPKSSFNNVEAIVALRFGPFRRRYIEPCGDGTLLTSLSHRRVRAPRGGSQGGHPACLEPLVDGLGRR